MNEWIKDTHTHTHIHTHTHTHTILSRAKNGGNQVICNNMDETRGYYEMAGWHYRLDVHDFG